MSQIKDLSWHLPHCLQNEWRNPKNRSYSFAVCKDLKVFFRKQEVLSPQAGLDEDEVSVKEDGCNWIPSEAASIPFASATCLNDCHRPRAKKHIHTHTDLHREERKGNTPPMWGADSQGRGNRRGGTWERTRRQRSPSNEYLVGVLPESWLVCSSINSWILHSSFFFLFLCWQAPGGGYYGGVGLVLLASCLARLIGSSWLDPGSFPHLDCDLILHSRASGMYLNAIFLYEFMKKRLVQPPRPR